MDQWHGFILLAIKSCPFKSRCRGDRINLKKKKPELREPDLIDRLLASRAPIEKFVGIVDREEVKKYHKEKVERINKIMDRYNVRKDQRYIESPHFSPHSLELALSGVVYQCLQNRESRSQPHREWYQALKYAINTKIETLQRLKDDYALLVLLKIGIKELEDTELYLRTRLESIQTSRTGPIKPISQWLLIVDFSFEFLGKSRYWMVKFICDLLREFDVEDIHGELVDEQLVHKWFGRLPM